MKPSEKIIFPLRHCFGDPKFGPKMGPGPDWQAQIGPGPQIGPGSKFGPGQVGPGPNLGPARLGQAQGRAKSGRSQLLLDPGKIAWVGPNPCPAKICPTLAQPAGFRPRQFCAGRPRAEIQAWGMGSGRFWLCPQPARPGQNCVGRTKICQVTFLPDPQIPGVPQVPRSLQVLRFCGPPGQHFGPGTFLGQFVGPGKHNFIMNLISYGGSGDSA